MTGWVPLPGWVVVVLVLVGLVAVPLSVKIN